MQVTDEAYRTNLLRVLADDQARKIMAYTISDCKSVIDIVRKCNIPHTTAYRLVNELKSQGFLFVERVAVAKDGKKYLLYRSSVKNAIVKFEESQITVEVSPNYPASEYVSEHP